MATVIRRTAFGVLSFGLSAIALAQKIEVPFHTDGDRQVLIVECRIEGRRANLIVDSGSAETIISPKMAESGGHRLPPAPVQSDTPGITGAGEWRETALQVGSDESTKRRVFVMNLDQVSARVGERIDGLLGLAFLRDFQRVTIDFKQRKLILER